MSDKIHPISQSTPWSWRAALGSAVDRMSDLPDDTGVLVLWLDDEGALCWSKTNLTMAETCIFSKLVDNMATSAVENDALACKCPECCPPDGRAA